MVFNFRVMGNSLPKGRRKSLRSFVRRSHNKTNLSHTFTLLDEDEPMELLNINTATEEELMTLSGINRELAKNIVDHRKAIGRYRKVEDLALVRGIGAVRMEELKPEICVYNKRITNGVSSRAPSYDSLKSTESRSGNRISRLLNVNKASVFDLQCVPGMSQEMAAGILYYRNKKGCFKTVDDLIKVKAISRAKLHNVYRYLTVEDDDDNVSQTSIPRPAILTNGFVPFQPLNGRSTRVSFRGHIPNGLTPSSAIDIFELLSTYSPRPVIGELFKQSRNGEPAARVASWNLNKFNNDKASNLGVKEVICRTILENGLSLIAVQDIREVSGLKTICEELNKPALRRIEEWKDNSHNWNFCMLDVAECQLGFIYDSGSVSAHVELISLMESPDDTRTDCDSLIAHFLIGDLNLQLVNMSLKRGANLDVLTEKVADLISEEESVVMCIDFSKYQEINDSALSLGGLHPLIPGHVNTHFPGLKTTNSSSHITNILFNAHLKRYLTGYKGMIGKGLTHLAIPNGWAWGGAASPNCPLWMEIFTTPKLNGVTP